MKIAIFGAGGHGKTVCDALSKSNPAEFDCMFLDDDVLKSYANSGLLSERKFVKKWPIIIAIGNPQDRKRLAELANSVGAVFATAIHPGASVAMDSEVMPGSYVGPSAVIGPDVEIGCHCIINLGASVAHGSRIANYVSVNDGARIGGDVTIEECAYIGMGAVVLPKLTIGAGAIVGAGAVVTKDVGPGVTVVGVPAKPINAP